MKQEFIKKGLFLEALGVPPQIYETSQKLYERLLSWIQKIPSKKIEDEEVFDFTVKGSFKISDYEFSTLKCFLRLQDSEKVEEPELIAMGVKTPTKRTDDFRLEILKSKTVELMIMVVVPKDSDTKLVYDFFAQNKNELVEALSHELKHVYDRSKRKFENPQKMALYNAAVEIKTGVPPIDTFIHDLYFGSATENLVRPSELLAAIKNNEVSQKGFIDFLKKNVTYQTLKRMENFNLNDFIKEIYDHPDKIDTFLEKGGLNPTNMKMRAKVESALTLAYVTIAHAAIDKYKELLAKDMLELLFGFKGEKQKLFERFANRNLRFTNPKDFFEFYQKFLNKVGVEMLKKISKLYSLTSANKVNESKIVTEALSDGYDAVLVGGLDYRSSDYPISQQVDILKKGFGFGKKVKGFRYNSSTSEILSFLSKNPKIPIFLFSAGCTKAYDLSNSQFVDPKKLYIIEPFAASSRTKQIVQSAVSNGVPASNVFVGGSSGRGKGVVSGASNSQSDSHWGALSKVGSMKSGVGPSEYSGDIDYISYEDKKSRPEDVKDFQSWLDDNHPGWHRKYGTLEDNIDRGWGIFGPNTKRAWRNLEWRDEYLNQRK